MENCPDCDASISEYMGAGIKFCTKCGLMQKGHFEEFFHWTGNEQMYSSCYTRLKRFRKYLSRACRMQGSSTVPDETWQLLLDRAPFTSPGHIVKTLKKARVRRKCYDSLPLMVEQLCPHIKVPTLDAVEFRQALEYFSKVDEHYRKKNSFISYLFVLEYILHKLKRSDMCPYLSRIQCRKRRLKYNDILDKIFGCRTSVGVTI